MKIFHISDTHGAFWETPADADIIVHTGDFFPDFHVRWDPARGVHIDREKAAHAQREWILRNTKKFRRSVGDRPFLFLPGNHDWCDDPEHVLRTGIPLLSAVPSIGGFAFVGMPLIPWIRRGVWNRESQESEISIALHAVREHFGAPAILVTHAPGFGVLDQCPASVGSKAIADFVASRQPVAHLHGHIHEANGMQLVGRTLVSNAATAGRVIEV